jgi:hypothetical protein
VIVFALCITIALNQQGYAPSKSKTQFSNIWNYLKMKSLFYYYSSFNQVKTIVAGTFYNGFQAFAFSNTTMKEA